MKKLDEIKKGLKACARDLNCNSCPYKGFRCTRLLMQDADDALRQLESQVPRWISVEERLPEKTGVYLVHCVHRYNNADMYSNVATSVFFLDARNVWAVEGKIYEVTHWRPMPKPPVEV